MTRARLTRLRLAHHWIAARSRYAATNHRRVDLLRLDGTIDGEPRSLLATRTEAAIASEGVVRVLVTRRLSTWLEADGGWNWWQIRASTCPPRTSAASDSSNRIEGPSIASDSASACSCV